MNPMMSSCCQRVLRQISQRSSWLCQNRAATLIYKRQVASCNRLAVPNAIQTSYFSTATEPQTSTDSSSASNFKSAPSPVEEVPREKAIPPPAPDGAETVFSQKISSIVDSIANLTLGEVTELNKALKERLNLPDVAAFPMGAAMAVPAAGVTEQAQEEEDFGAPKKTAFSVKLLSFDSEKKVALIKEIKNNVAGYNLVQAKKFVESLPQVVKYDLAKDDAEKLMQLIEAAGGKCEIE